MPAELGDGLVQEVDVELETDRGHVPGLLGAEQLAGASDLEVAHRDREAGAELGVVGERREPCPGLLGQLRSLGEEQVRVRRDVRPADAATDLVELREPEQVGPLDDERVRLRYVETRLDDRRRDEHVGIASEELHHPALELLLPHLAVGDEDPKARAELLELLCRLLDRLHAVVEVERLPAALGLTLERDLHELRVVLPHVGADRPPTFRRRLDQRDVAEP